MELKDEDIVGNAGKINIQVDTHSTRAGSILQIN